MFLGPLHLVGVVALAGRGGVVHDDLSGQLSDGYVCVCMCVYIYIYVYVYMYVCMYVYIYIYIHTHM